MKATEVDFLQAADVIGCEVAVIKAIVAVESSGAGFDAEGRLLVRFEGHWFRKYTTRRYDVSHPHLSYEFGDADRWGHGRTVFNEAVGLNEKAALLSTSYGLFQIMGFNYEACGFRTVGEFVDFNKAGEGNQIICFIRLLKAWGLQQALKNKAWATIARKWNGASYRKNRYDAKLAVAYKRFAS